MGGLGFLTETTLDDLYGSLEKVFAGKYRLDQRLMLQVGIHHQGKRMSEATVLNDVVIAKGHLARMISTQVSINRTFNDQYSGRWVDHCHPPLDPQPIRYRAGGPILDPSLEVLLINPILPTYPFPPSFPDSKPGID